MILPPFVAVSWLHIKLESYFGIAISWWRLSRYLLSRLSLLEVTQKVTLLSNLVSPSWHTLLSECWMDLEVGSPFGTPYKVKCFTWLVSKKHVSHKATSKREAHNFVTNLFFVKLKWRTIIICSSIVVPLKWDFMLKIQSLNCCMPKLILLFLQGWYRKGFWKSSANILYTIPTAVEHQAVWRQKVFCSRN